MKNAIPTVGQVVGILSALLGLFLLAGWAAVLVGGGLVLTVFSTVVEVQFGRSDAQRNGVR